MRSRTSFLALAVVSTLAAPAFAFAQTPPAPLGPAKQAEQARFSLKHHISVQLSGGWDMDVIGNLTVGAQGTRDSHDIIINPTAYTDVYAIPPKRVQGTFGYGLFSGTEILARYSQANYPSSLNEVGVPGALMTMKMSPYNERSTEFGLRHYFATGPTIRRYVSFLYGIRRIDALHAVFTAEPPDPDPNVGDLAMYQASHVPTIDMEFGMTLESRHIGMFIETGAHWQKRLIRDDTDLAPFGLQLANNTGARFYIPLQIGLLLRL